MIHVDTHVLLWLYTGGRDRLPPQARTALDRQSVASSPAVRFELTYLAESGKVAGPPDELFNAVGPTLSLAPATASFAEVIREAETMAWTRDPFDRLIAAHAAADRAWLLTSDRTIRANFDGAWWP